jgi:L-threonylcarbamoyladenylate synthase
MLLADFPNLTFVALMAEVGKDIKKAQFLLEQGELVAIPTETVYGLAGNALDTRAVALIFETKGRPQFDPLIVHVPDLDRASAYVTHIPEKARTLAEAFWPGPLTLLLQKKSLVPDLVTAGLDTVGIRCPDHDLTRALLRALPFPLAAPSANPFGYVSPTEPAHVQDQLGSRIPYILDGGVCQVGIESTIVGVEGEHAVVYRMGGLSIEAIEQVIGPLEVQIHSTSNPKAPGQLKSHYAPGKRVVMGNIAQLLETHAGARLGVLSFQKDYGVAHQFVLSQAGSLTESAQRLFLALRELDKMPVDLILAEYVPNTGLGRAINDRLRRAAAE